MIRGGEASFRLALDCRTPFPLPRVKVRLRWENRLTGEGDALSWAPAPGETAGELTVPAAHCGCLACRAEGAWTCDLLGLFPIPLRKPAPAEVLSLPRPVELEVPPGLLSGRSEGAALRPRPGGGPGEDYDLRGLPARRPPALRPLEAVLQAGRAGGEGDPGAPPGRSGAHL